MALRKIAAGGIVGQADAAVGRIAPIADQEVVFWFTLWGVLTIFLGQMAVLAERHGETLPRWFGWQMFIVNVVAAALLPKGGFWWVLLPAALIIRGKKT